MPDGSDVAVITGASSGVGRACAIALAARGFRCALIARSRDSLEAVRLTLPHSDSHLSVPCDIADAESVARAAAQILSHFGAAHVLVNAAGTNVKDRSLETLSLEDYQRVINTNLTGAFLMVSAFLPAMRKQARGTVVNVVSDAGLVANAKAGPAYVASKFGLTGLTQSINAEERGRGVRAVAIFPGDIDTPLIDKRPTPPPPEVRAKYLQPEDIAACVLLAVTLPPRAIVEQLLIRPA